MKKLLVLACLLASVDANAGLFSRLRLGTPPTPPAPIIPIVIPVPVPQPKIESPAPQVTDLIRYDNWDNEDEGTVSAVPVPAALPLMASALGMFGIARRRKSGSSI